MQFNLKKTAVLCGLFALLFSCKPKTFEPEMISVRTPSGTFNVWTKRFGNNSGSKVLLLHGAGLTHEQFECFETYFSRVGIEFYEYDQLGSFYSDQPNDTSLWKIDRMVEEVEQVRQALGLNKENFFLLGHDFGGMLAIQYALKYQENLKGLIVCNAFSSTPNQEGQILRLVNSLGKPKDVYGIVDMDDKNDFDNPKYKELRARVFKGHIIRTSIVPQPLARTFSHINTQIDTVLYGRSLFIEGRLQKVNIRDSLANIRTPTLMVGATHDFVDWEHMRHMSEILPGGEFLLCRNGSHYAMWDDQKFFMDGVISFIKRIH
jgi:proline iminopeptidase